MYYATKFQNGLEIPNHILGIFILLGFAVLIIIAKSKNDD